MPKKHLLHILLALSFMMPLLPGCTTTRVVSKYDCDTVSNNPLNKKTTWSFAWGLVEPKPITPNCDPRFNHMNQVQSKTNLGYALITVVTLGIVMPQQVEWCCAPYSPPTDSLNQRP
jgi:Bor protein